MDILPLLSESAIDRFWSKVDVKDLDDCWEWKGALNENGYGRITFQGKLFMSHRVSWAIARNQEVPPGLVVRHGCDNPACNNPSHLMIGTQHQNVLDAVERKRHAFGERAGNVRLTAEKVANIKILLLEGKTNAEISVLFGVTESCINGIARGAYWKHINPEITQAIRSRKRMNKGKKGELSPASKLTTNAVLEIRDLALKGIPIPEISEQYNQRYATVYAVVRRLTWKHI